MVSNPWLAASPLEEDVGPSQAAFGSAERLQLRGAAAVVFDLR